MLFASCIQQEKSVAKTEQTIVIPNTTITATNSLLKVVNGVYQYKGIAYAGAIETYYPNSKQLQMLQTYYNGKEEGWLNTYFPNGAKENKRYFHLGEKDSVHCGWWPNGNLRFEYHFSKGNYHGDFKEFYASGKPLRFVQYNNGFDIEGKGWRENGKPFMSYVNKDGRRYGLLNAQPCYTLKNERGEYIKGDTLR